MTTIECKVTCPMHELASQWLVKGERKALLEHLDVFYTLRRRAWQGCTCSLYKRILMEFLEQNMLK